MSRAFDVHPELQSIKARTIPLNRWTLAAMQTLLSAVNVLHRRKFKKIATRVVVPSQDAYPIPALVIRPEHLRSRAPALIYYHGGAFVMKPAPQHVENAVRYAREAECTVVFGEYRLAPKHSFPAGFNDCYALLRWALAHAEQLGIDTERLVVGGDSAGGGLAAGVVQRAVHEDNISLRAQLLLYPAVDLLCNRPSRAAFANVPPFKNLPAGALADIYLGHAASQDVPRYASPLYGNVSRLAPAYVETPEFDMLHDQGVAYAQAMIDQGVDVELNEIAGGIHGFDLLAPLSSVSRGAMTRRIAFLRRVFRAGVSS